MNQKIYRALFECLRDQPAVLAVQLGGPQGKREEIKKQLYCGPQFDGAAKDAFERGVPVFKSGSDINMLYEPFYPKERLIVLGGGHIALPLTDFAKKTGFSVTVSDDRPTFANIARFPFADVVICEAFDKAIEKLNITGSDYVVIITRGHRHDALCLEQILKGPEPAYIGMIGSRRRVAAVKELLIEKGCNAEKLSRVHSPIGIDIGAVTPEEIAISITAELIACKRLRNDKPGGVCKSSGADYKLLRVLAEEGDVPKAIATVISAKGSVPRGAGAKMLVYPYNETLGSIGGGCSEAAVIDIARQIIGTGRYCLHTVDLTAEAAEEEGMVCGGTMQVLIEDY